MKQENFRSFFGNIRDVPIDPVFGVLDRYKKDPRPHKIHLSVGVLIDEKGKVAPEMKAIKEAESKILAFEKDKNYLPIDGDPVYVEATGKLIFGDLYSDRIYGAQTVGGTSALRLGADFLKEEISTLIAISNPTWPNHIQVFQRSGLQVESYPYFEGTFDFSRLYDQIKTFKEGSVVLLQPTSHNPTGVDLKEEEWKELSRLFLQKRLFPFFDSAYQGFGKGLQLDPWPIRYFVQEGHECLVAHSYSKSMGLYNERVGALFVVMRDGYMIDKMRRNIRSLIRTDYSNPPAHGSSIAKRVLLDPDLRPLWELELEEIRLRIVGLRNLLSTKLKKAMPERSVESIEKGNGFFTLLGLSRKQVALLQEKDAIYTTDDSRINLAALSPTNVDLIVEAVKRVV